jgi:hypothetical protein
MKRRRVLVAAVAGALIAGMQPALAEGSWTSYMQGVLVGFDSRTWTDHNSDSVSTHVYLYGCSGWTFNLQLTRETPWYEPDEDRGHRAYWNCGRTSGETRYWGDQPSGDYHFSVIDCCGDPPGDPDYPRSAKTVQTWY